MNFTSTITSSPGDTFKFVLPFSDTDVTIYTSIICVLFVFGLIGNLLTIITVTLSQKLNSTWYQLITSLAVSDIISALNSPLLLYKYTWGFEVWNWTRGVCKLAWSFDYLTSYVTTLHILWFALLRFISLQWSHRFTSFDQKHGKISIFVLWVLSFVGGFIPYMVMVEPYDRDRSLPIIQSMWTHCGIPPVWFNRFSWYTRIAYAIYFYIPFILIFCASVGIGIKVYLTRRKRNALREIGLSRTSEKTRRRKGNRIVLQLFLIVGSFMLGYFPSSAFHFFVVAATFTTNQNYWDLTWRFAIGSHILLRISECLNPIFYNLSSSKMRQETKEMLQKFWMNIRCSKLTKRFHSNASSQPTDPANM